MMLILNETFLYQQKVLSRQVIFKIHDLDLVNLQLNNLFNLQLAQAVNI